MENNLFKSNQEIIECSYRKIEMLKEDNRKILTEIIKTMDIDQIKKDITKSYEGSEELDRSNNSNHYDYLFGTGNYNLTINDKIQKCFSVNVVSDEWHENPFKEWSMLGSVIVKSGGFEGEEWISDGETFEPISEDKFCDLRSEYDYLNGSRGNNADKNWFIETTQEEYEIEINLLEDYDEYLNSLNIVWERFNINSYNSFIGGIIYISREKILKEYGNTDKETIEKVKGYISNEIETLRKYVDNELFAYELTDYQTTETEYCGGYLTKEDALEQALGNLNWYKSEGK